MEETILSDGFLEDYIQRCQTDSPQEKVGRQKQHESVARELRQIEQRMENLITALADASLPTLEVSHRYKKEEAKKKELEARLSKQKTVATNFKVDLEEFRHLMRLELQREETRKAALHALIEEHVQEAILNEGSWQLTDPTALAGAPPAAGEPSGLVSGRVNTMITQLGSR